MTQSKLIMGMPITVTIEDENFDPQIFDEVFDYFNWVDEKFSPFKNESELSKINQGKIVAQNYSQQMKLILDLADQTKKQSLGYFDIIDRQGKLNPSGIVKGWAILNAAKLIENKRVKKFYIEAGGDIQAQGKVWKVGIENPFNRYEIIKSLEIRDQGVATSGTYLRGQHIYNPFAKDKNITDIISLTVIGPNVYEADRFATVAFAMGREGINFIEELEGFEGYMVNSQGIATMTTNFEKYVSKNIG